MLRMDPFVVGFFCLIGAQAYISARAEIHHIIATKFQPPYRAEIG